MPIICRVSYMSVYTKLLSGDIDMRYAKIREMDISNGEGIGVSLFVQGCHFHCKGCFNQETWDFNGGEPWTEEVKAEFMRLVKKPYVKRVSILGGEPLSDENAMYVLDLIISIKSKFPNIQIWLYTGYTVKEIVTSLIECSSVIDVYKVFCLLFSDVVVDGRFEIDKQDDMNKNIVFAGSTNQRVIRNTIKVIMEELCKKEECNKYDKQSKDDKQS